MVAIAVVPESLDVFPRLPASDVTDVRSAYPIVAGNVAVEFTSGATDPDGANVVIRQTGLLDHHANGPTLLGLFIGHVHSVSSQEEMGRIDAARVIARMADDQSIRDGSEREFVAVSVRADALSVDSEVAVTLLGQASPLPTLVGFADSIPETDGRMGVHRLIPSTAATALGVSAPQGFSLSELYRTQENN